VVMSFVQNVIVSYDTIMNSFAIIIDVELAIVAFK
jgi:hypothetical protein